MDKKRIKTSIFLLKCGDDMSDNDGLLLVFLYLPFGFYMFHLQEKLDKKLEKLYEETLRNVLYKEDQIMLMEEIEIRQTYKWKEFYTQIYFFSFLVFLLAISFITLWGILAIALFLAFHLFIDKTDDSSLRPHRMIIDDNLLTLEMNNIIRNFDMDEMEDISLDYRNVISFTVTSSINKERIQINHEKAWYLYEYIIDEEVVF